MFGVTVRILTPLRPIVDTFGFAGEKEAALFIDKVNEKFPETAELSEANDAQQLPLNDALASVFRQSLGFAPASNDSEAWLARYEAYGLDVEE